MPSKAIIIRLYIVKSGREFNFILTFAISQQVTSICIMENEIYIGTTWGCIVVAERESMRPITVFRPYNEEVSAILTLPVQQNGRPCLATVGRGYRSLIARYKSLTSYNKDFGLLNNTFAILWSTGHWAI